MKLPVSSGRKPPYKLQTKNLSYKLSSKFEDYIKFFFCGSTSSNPDRATNKLILKVVNCEARPAQITAIAGPSGAGKTTLLEILAGRIPPCKVASGEMLVNDRPIDVKKFRRISGYVTQDDALFPLLTIQETLMYSALLRLPGGRKEANCRVKALLKELGLEHVSNSRIGGGSSSNNSGISGGERRRVSIGIDLVHDPAVILIDEPTSGLDSASALHVVTLLKSMAINQGKTIVLTVHQPGFRILELFDRIVLLSNGFAVHNGPLNLLEERLKFADHQIPPRVNVLEFAIDEIESLAIIPNSVPGTGSGSIINLEDHSPILHLDQRKLNLFHPNSRMGEVLILGQRFCSNIFRTKQLFATRVIQALVAGFVLGTIYFNVGNDHGRTSLQTQTGFFAFTLTFLLSSTTEGLPIFLQERRILMRETSRGAYRVSSYVLANTIVFLPFLFMVSILFASPVYWLVGLRRDNIDGFLYFTLVVWMVLLMSNSFVACFSALVPNFIMGNSVIAGLMGSFFLFSGYFIAKDKIPNYWVFMHYLSLFKYPFECFMINEFGGKQGQSKCLEFENGECSLFGSWFLRQQNLKDSQKWSNLAVMLGFIIGYRLLCLFILWYRCYRERN